MITKLNGNHEYKHYN